MSDADFLAAILETPDDDFPRLAYADFLDERGQAARAEFIRVQCALALAKNPDPISEWCNRCQYVWDYCVCRDRRASDARQRGRLRTRERELWTGCDVGFADGVPDDWIPTLRIDAEQSQADPGRCYAIYARGFVESVTCPARDWITNADVLLTRQPVRMAALTTVPEVRVEHTGDTAISGDVMQSSIEGLDRLVTRTVWGVPLDPEEFLRMFWPKVKFKLLSSQRGSGLFRQVHYAYRQNAPAVNDPRTFIIRDL